MGQNRRAIPVENKFRRQWETIDRAGQVNGEFASAFGI
jgi:hypothetical protein